VVLEATCEEAGTVCVACERRDGAVAMRAAGVFCVRLAFLWQSVLLLYRCHRSEWAHGLVWGS
jgi:hypothetical protein